MQTTWRVERLEPGRRPDFYRLHCAERDAGWCACVAWWVETWEGWGERTASENRALREELFDRGQDDGYLLYEQDDPIAWCQVGPRDRLTKLVRELRLAPDPEAWGLTCFLVAPSHRRRGAARFLLEAVLADLPRRGARRIEAYPRSGDELDELALWNGPRALYEAAGFRLVRDVGRRAVYGRELPAPGSR